VLKGGKKGPKRKKPPGRALQGRNGSPGRAGGGVVGGGPNLLSGGASPACNKVTTSSGELSPKKTSYRERHEPSKKIIFRGE